MFRVLTATTALICVALPLTASSASRTAWMSNGLYRQVTEKERASLGKHFAEAVHLAGDVHAPSLGRIASPCQK